MVTSTSTYDDLNRITALDHSRGSTSITGYGFTYDVGSRMTALDFTKSTCNAEDATWTGQLTSANRCGTGTLQNHLTSDSFGRIKAESNAAVDYLFGYAGIERDEKTGLDRADHRYYDSGMQRWITEDPTGFGGGDKNVQRNVGNGTTN